MELVLLQILAKNHDVQFFDFIFDIVIVRPLLSALDFQSFTPVLVVLLYCIFVYCICGKQALAFPHWKVWRSCHCHVFKQKQQCNCIRCCHGNLVVLSTVAVVPILCGIVILHNQISKLSQLNITRCNNTGL